MRALVVTGYTPGYADVAARMLASCARFSVPVYAVPYEPGASWEHNCAHKPRIMLEAAYAHPGRALIWIDADAEIVVDPALFDELDCDVSYHRYRHETLSGTVYVGPAGTPFLSRWADLAERRGGWDQLHLDEAALGLRWIDLPPEYVWISDTFERAYGKRYPAIVHHQASREVRRGARKP